MNILLTGSEGFIGSRIKYFLQKEGYTVIPFDKTTGDDILNYNNLFEKISHADFVIHVAAQANLYEMENITKGLEGVDINTQGTNYIAHVCSRLNKKLIYASTVCVYGNQKTPTNEKSQANPSDLYAFSKYAGEVLIKGYNKNFNLNYIILRLATTYGSNMRSALGMHIFFTQSLKNADITVHGNGRQTRTLTHVDDIARSFILAIKNFETAKNNTFNITSSDKISALKMAKDIKKLTKSKSRIASIPQRKNQTFKENISNKKAIKLLGWKPLIKWSEGLKNTLDWIKVEI